MPDTSTMNDDGFGNIPDIMAINCAAAFFFIFGITVETAVEDMEKRGWKVNPEPYEIWREIWL